MRGTTTIIDYPPSPKLTPLMRLDPFNLVLELDLQRQEKDDLVAYLLCL